MLKIGNEAVITQAGLYFKAYKESTSAPLFFDEYIAATLPKVFKQSGIKYPLDVKIPKSLEKLIQKDLEPELKFTIDSPFMLNVKYKSYDRKSMIFKEEERAVPIWFGSSAEQINLRFGYKDGNSNVLSTFGLGDKDIHMFMGGATGQGKSVALNNLIFNICIEYPPWEVELILSDPKIVEFKKYAMNYPMPHLKNVVATDDGDYLLSVITYLTGIMHSRNRAFSNAGASNIIEFRKRTGLCVPRIIFVGDEVQYMMKSAGRYKNMLSKNIDAIGRLGRNTGVHLLFATQEMDDSIDPETFASIKLRGALGCLGKVSTKILGNEEAKMYYGTKGYLVVNNNPGESDPKISKRSNNSFRVPFLTDSRQEELGKWVLKKGKTTPFKRIFNFYDDVAVVREGVYAQYLKTFTLDENTIALGEPARLSQLKENVLKIKYTNKSFENTLVLSENFMELIRYSKMLRTNIELMRDVTNFVWCADPVYEDYLDCKSFTNNKLFYSNNNSYEECDLMQIAKALVMKRQLALEIDDAIFEGNPFEVTEEYDRTFYSFFDKGDKYDSVLNRKRFMMACGLMLTKAKYTKAFQLDGSLGNKGKKSAEERADKLASDIIFVFEDARSLNTRIVKDNYKLVNYTIYGLNMIRGIARDTRSMLVTDLKNFLNDCCSVKVRCYITASSIRDCSEIRDCIRYFIFSELSNSMQSSIKVADLYPTTLGKTVGVLYNTNAKDESDKIVKFKKMFFDDETI